MDEFNCLLESNFAFLWRLVLIFKAVVAIFERMAQVQCDCYDNAKLKCVNQLKLTDFSLRGTAG